MDRFDTLKERYRLKIAYDGSGAFYGWQIQSNKRSIQGLLKEALQISLRDRSIHPIGSGRTDTGVHARGQIAHFDMVKKKIDLTQTLRELNGLLPPYVRVLAIERSPKEFHARYHAIGKIYHYHIDLAPVKNLFYRLYRWHVPQALDRELLVQACQALAGRHDFKSLANNNKKGAAAHDSVRTLHRVEPYFRREELYILFEGEGFLYKMVRNSVGLLIGIAKGSYPFQKLQDLLKNSLEERTLYCAPAHGLVLDRVLYENRWGPSQVLDLPQIGLDNEKIL